MKRYFYILLLTTLALNSCDLTVIDGERPGDIGGKNSIEVLKSDIIFSPDASEGYVLVKTEGGISARSTRDWCSVECFDDSVAVRTASNYENLDSRYAQVIIYHKGDSAVFNVHQEGPLVNTFDDSAVVFGHDAADGEINFMSNMLPVVTSSVSWATAEVSKNVVKVHVKRNSTEEFRSGVLTCSLGPETYNVTVMQLDPSEILSNRNWKMEITMTDDTKLSLTGVLSKLGANYTMALSGTGIDWSFPATMTKNQLNIPLGTSVGRYESDGRNYHVFPVVGEGENAGMVSGMAATGAIGLAMDLDKESGKWHGTLDMKPFVSMFDNPVFRFEYWLNSSKTGLSSGGLRVRELTIVQQ